ncbi:MAG: hypothetical protein R3F48_08295 [Candidatus Zixiibacteriota bacterium]
MPLSKELQDKLAYELRKKLPLMDVEKVRKEFLAWLADFKFPGRENATSWEECLTVVPRVSDTTDAEDGVKMRFALKLFTAKNKYLITILECFDPNSRGIYILTVHTNWDEAEKRILRRIENQYCKDFDDSLKARHTIWAQSFQNGELATALDSAAKAILAQELTAQTETIVEGKPIAAPRYSAPAFTQSTDDENLLI